MIEKAAAAESIVALPSSVVISKKVPPFSTILDVQDCHFAHSPKEADIAQYNGLFRAAPTPPHHRKGKGKTNG
eukprot:scaffold10264_cov60-Cylindrotheca_fusiformis.AAC.1